jgi:hypothetical protein
MPAPRKPSPSSPATEQPRPPAARRAPTTSAGQPDPINPAVAARLHQLAAQAEHRRAIAEFRARNTADQQVRIDALLLEIIAALASLFSEPGRTGNHPA